MLARFSEIIIISVFSKRRPQGEGCRLIALTERFLVYYKVLTIIYTGLNKK
jgi:hypothetical protein